MDNYIVHHGIKGQKWGIRRYQYPDGSLTPEGRRHRRVEENVSRTKISKETAGKIAVAALLTASVAAAAVYVSKHPEAAVKVAKYAGTKVKDLSSAAAKKGKAYVKKAAKLAVQGLKEGVKEGLKEAPKKAAKTIMVGAAMLAAKRALDNAVGKDEAAKIFTANNSKKIDKFWRAMENDSQKDDD